MMAYSPVPITGDWAEKRRFGGFVEADGAYTSVESASRGASKLRRYVCAAATVVLGAILVSTTVAAICASVFMSMSRASLSRPSSS